MKIDLIKENIWGVSHVNLGFMRADVIDELLLGLYSPESSNVLPWVMGVTGNEGEKRQIFIISDERQIIKTRLRCFTRRLIGHYGRYNIFQTFNRDYTFFLPVLVNNAGLVNKTAFNWCFYNS